MAEQEYVMYDGELLPKDATPITSQNRSFRYGDGIFETIRCQQLQPLWLSYHYNRLQYSAQILNLIIPEELYSISFSSKIAELLEKNNHASAARVRLSIFREDGGLYTPLSNKAHYLIESSPLPDENYHLNSKGLSAGIYQQITKSNNLLSNIKSTSALFYVLASGYAKKNHWDEVIILNDSGYVAEAGSSNIFMAVNDTLYTPSLDQSCVNGVMRNVILDLALLHNFKVVECAISIEDLLHAEEVFTTNTIKGVQWIKGVQSKRYFHDISQRLIDLLFVSANDSLS